MAAPSRRAGNRKSGIKRAPARRTPRKARAGSRGLTPEQCRLEERGKEAEELRARVEGEGGLVVGWYRDPLGKNPLLVAVLPIDSVEPTPFQRDLSPTHTKRLAAKIEEAGSFLDPLIVVRGEDGKLWTPNGRHRLAAAKVLGLKQVTALVSPDEDLAFRILALNTEKAHNLKDRSLEVIRMARSLAKRRPGSKEAEFTAEFEAPDRVAETFAQVFFGALGSAGLWVADSDDPEQTISITKTQKIFVLNSCAIVMPSPSSTRRSANSAVATPIGRLTKKIQCQLMASVSTPPTSRPIEPPATATKV